MTLPTEQVHEARLFERRPRSRNGIKASGSAADGGFSIFIGEQKVSEPAEKNAHTTGHETVRRTVTNADGGDGREPTPRGVAAAHQVGSPQARPRRESGPMKRTL